jgi:hypothetical protein
MLKATRARGQQGATHITLLTAAMVGQPFSQTEDYEAFLSLLGEAKKRHCVKILGGFCLSPITFTSF